jgi:hypothetical protein
MKLTNQTKRTKGMTLLELTVVILVLLSLISILFIGARAWKKGSDRAGCIMNLRNAQQAVRSHANMRGLDPADTFVESEVFGPGLYVEQAVADMVCPQEGAGAYSAAASGTVPDVGVLYLACSAPAADLHVPDDVTGW